MQEDMEIVGGEHRPYVNLEADGDLQTWILRGLSEVYGTAMNSEGEEFNTHQVRFVVMMDKTVMDADGVEIDLTSRDDYDEEFTMSFGGQVIIDGVISKFADKTKLKEDGEVWLDDRWLNKRCSFALKTNTSSKSGNMYYTLAASKKPEDAKRKDLPDECSPVAAYQQADRQDDEIGGGSTYEM